MPPSIWISWALYAFLAFSRLFLISHWNFLLPPSVGCDPSRDFVFMKEKSFRLKKASQGMYLFQKVKGITKMAFPHFKRKQLRSINFDLIQCDGLVFAKMHFINHEQRVHYIPLFIHLKTHDSKVMEVSVFIHFFLFLFFFIIFMVYNLVTSMMELLDSLVILQVECEKYHFWMNIKLFLKSKYQIKFSKLQ